MVSTSRRGLRASLSRVASASHRRLTNRFAGKVAVDFTDLGEQTLKNIARPDPCLCGWPERSCSQSAHRRAL